MCEAPYHKPFYNQSIPLSSWSSKLYCFSLWLCLLLVAFLFLFLFLWTIFVPKVAGSSLPYADISCRLSLMLAVSAREVNMLEGGGWTACYLLLGLWYKHCPPFSQLRWYFCTLYYVIQLVCYSPMQSCESLDPVFLHPIRFCGFPRWDVFTCFPYYFCRYLKLLLSFCGNILVLNLT